MNLLLDTHVLLWWLADDASLSPRVREVVADGENIVFVSAVTVWEIRIKHKLGKLRIPGNFRQILDGQLFLPLDITAEHAHTVGELPDHHRDPFDRMLLAQAAVEKLTVVTADSQFEPYGLPLIRN